MGYIQPKAIFTKKKENKDMKKTAEENANEIINFLKKHPEELAEVKKAFNDDSVVDFNNTQYSSSFIKRDGQPVKNASSEVIKNIKDFEKEVKNSNLSSDLKNKTPAMFRKEAGLSYENPPVSRGGVSVKDLRDKDEQELKAKEEIKKGLEDIINITNARSNNSSAEPVELVKPFESAKTSWKSDKEWFNNWTAEQENTDEKDDTTMFKDLEMAVSKSYGKFLIAKRNYLLNKKELDNYYKTVGINDNEL